MRVPFIFSAALLLVSCYSYKPMKSIDKTVVSNVEESISRVETGKEYRFCLADGSRIDIKVNHTSKDSISGVKFGFSRNNKVSVQVNDIIAVQRKKPDVVRNVLIALVSVTTVVVVIGAANSPYIY